MLWRKFRLNNYYFENLPWHIFFRRFIQYLEQLLKYRIELFLERLWNFKLLNDSLLILEIPPAVLQKIFQMYFKKNPPKTPLDNPLTFFFWNCSKNYFGNSFMNSIQNCSREYLKNVGIPLQNSFKNVSRESFRNSSSVFLAVSSKKKKKSSR